MALTKDVNSYVTVEEANTYFADRLDVAAWTSASDTQKAQALIAASSLLDDMSWVGTAVSENQPLAFPRAAEYFDPKIGVYLNLDGIVVPSRILIATKELAYHLLNNDGIQDDTGAVQDIEVGSIKLKNVERPNLIPEIVKRQINPLLVNQGANLWWRAN